MIRNKPHNKPHPRGRNVNKKPHRRPHGITPTPTPRAHCVAQRNMSTTLQAQNYEEMKFLYPKLPKHVKIVEVGPRDGLQNVNEILDTNVKVKFINKLSQTGLKVIEAGSFVSPKWVPQMSDSDEVFKRINRAEDVEYPVLVPNLKGMERALECGAKEIAVFAAASQAFSQKNINCSIQQSIDRFEPVFQEAKLKGVKVRGYVSTVLGCPYQGDVSPDDVARVSKLLYEKGCSEISLGDTIGVGTPFTTHKMLTEVLKVVPVDHLAVHFHDTYNMALANVQIALQHGIATVDSSVSGLGGCPYAAGASGNLGTEDVVYMLNGMGVDTGVDMEALLNASRYITGNLHIRPSSKTSRVLIAQKKKFATEFINAADEKKRALVPH